MAGGCVREAAVNDKGNGGSAPRLQGLDSNPQGEFGPRFWQAPRKTFAHIYELSLPNPSEEARFTLFTVALTTAFARARLRANEADHLNSRKKAALDYVDAHGDWALQLNLAGPLRDRVVRTMRFDPDRVMPAAIKAPSHKH